MLPPLGGAASEPEGRVAGGETSDEEQAKPGDEEATYLIFRITIYLVLCQIIRIVYPVRVRLV